MMKFAKIRGLIISLTVTVVTASLFSGCSLLPKEEATLAPPLVQPKKQEYELGKVQKGSIEKKVVGSGVFVSASEYPIFFKDNGKRIKHIDVQVGDKVKRGQVLVETEIGDLDTQVKIEQYNVQLRQLDLDQANAANDSGQIARAKINLEIEQTKLDSLNSQLQGAKLTSPIDGQVTFVENLKDGDSVDPYKTIVTIGDPKKLMVNYQSTDLSQVSLGMKANVIVGGNTVTGTVITLPSTSTANTDDANKNSINIKLSQAVSNAKVGDTAEIEIVVESKSNTLIIPKRALRKFANSYTVDVWDGTSKKELTVEPGIQTATDVEILSGLSEGQNVILN